VPTAEFLGKTEKEVAEVAPADPPSDAPVEEVEYTLAAGDVLEFRCFDDESLSKDAIVRYDGCVSLSLVPDIHVQGITREEAEDLLREAYSAIFKDPQLSLTVRESASRVYYVIGDVTSPNEYPYTRRVNILQAINKAGGLRVQYRSSVGGGEYGSGLGSLTQAFVIRHSQEGREVIECDLTGLTESGPHPSQLALMPDDIVYVPEGVNLIYVIGEVQRPGVYQLTENMTVLRLVAQAGGHIASTARLRHVVLIRETTRELSDVLVVDVRELVRTGRDLRLEAGDIVYVPQKPLIRVRDFVSRFTGSIAPLLDLYIQGWEAYYAEDRLKAITDISQVEGQTTIQVLEGIRSLGSIIQPDPLPTTN
jgi:polysaccharide export outer membrane protein